MPTDGGSPKAPLSEVPLTDLLERARSVADNSSIMTTRGELMLALRARGLSWREIQAETGIAQSNARRWAKLYEHGQ